MSEGIATVQQRCTEELLLNVPLRVMETFVKVMQGTPRRELLEEANSWLKPECMCVAVCMYAGLLTVRLHE